MSARPHPLPSRQHGRACQIQNAHVDFSALFSTLRHAPATAGEPVKSRKIMVSRDLERCSSWSTCFGGRMWTMFFLFSTLLEYITLCAPIKTCGKLGKREQNIDIFDSMPRGCCGFVSAGTGAISQFRLDSHEVRLGEFAGFLWRFQLRTGNQPVPLTDVPVNLTLSVSTLPYFNQQKMDAEPFPQLPDDFPYLHHGPHNLPRSLESSVLRCLHMSARSQ